MSCIDSQDPSDLTFDVSDPGDTPGEPTPEIFATSGIYYDLGGSAYIEFEVDVSPINYAAAVEFDFSTSNGTALSGTHYTARTGIHVIIPAGEGEALLQVTVLKNSTFHGDKTFTITLSNPVNAVITDATAIQTIHYDPAPPPTETWKLPSFLSWPDNKAVIYNQFANCKSQNACTAYSVATAVSYHEYRDTGRKIQFDADKLFADTYGASCLTCTGCSAAFGTTSTLKHAKVTGVKQLSSSTFRKIQSWKQLSYTTHAEQVLKIKKAVAQYGVVIMETIFYSKDRHLNTGTTDWNLYQFNHPNNKGIIPDPGTTKSTGGHSWIIIGWNDNIPNAGGIGGFRVQNSFGNGWGTGGRGWLPYGMIPLRQVRDGTPSHSWFRFYYAEMKPGG